MKLRTTMMGAFLGVALLSPAFADDIAQDLSGTYTVKGRAAAGTEPYQGEVAVAKLGDTYRVAWALEDHRAVGTGILTDNRTFAVTFVAQGMPVPGIAVFDLGEHGELTGRFTLLGAREVGLETWTPHTH